VKKVTPLILEKGRIRTGPYASMMADGLMGAFIIRLLNGVVLRIISSGPYDETGWEHVSVSIENRCPVWAEMCFVKDLFWDDEEAVMQLHPPKSTYVNCHPYCLHLWKPSFAIPLPDSLMVGPKGKSA
jgi:hypothetical protein